MKVIGFIGASGTGKSHHALVVAYEHHIPCIIDDGLLIYQNRIVAGQSAKEETNTFKAVRRAIFSDDAHAASICRALQEIQPHTLLILGTSRHMICRICQALHLPEASSYIRIEDVSCPEEIAKARAIRQKEGKHIIPVPTMELKTHFRGYLLNSVRSLFAGRSGQKTPDFEHSVVRPVFSYYGKLIFSPVVLEKIVRHSIGAVPGMAKIHRLKVEKNYHAGANGLAVILSVSIFYGENIRSLTSRMKQAVQQDLEYTTGMSLDVLKITIRSVVPAPETP